jgi:hypothetical protein
LHDLLRGLNMIVLNPQTITAIGTLLGGVAAVIWAMRRSR